MAQETVISIPSTSSSSAIEICKGELVYTNDGNSFKKLVHKILGKEANNSEVLGQKLDNLNTKNLAQLRRQIAYISDDLYLSEVVSVQTNIDIYAKSIGLASPPTFINAWMQNTKLRQEDIVEELNTIQKHQLRIIIGLAKNPKLVILANPISQIDNSVYLKSMEGFYSMMMEKGLTLITSYSNAQLMSQFPGRVIQLN